MRLKVQPGGATRIDVSTQKFANGRHDKAIPDPTKCRGGPYFLRSEEKQLSRYEMFEIAAWKRLRAKVG